MFDSPFLWLLVLYTIVIIVYIRDLRKRDETDRTIWINGVKHIAHMDWKNRAYSYLTARGQVDVCVRDGAIIANGPEEGKSRPATSEEVREWTRMFEIVPIMPF